jgi:DNA-binding IclR family transcriptional regulator
MEKSSTIRGLERGLQVLQLLQSDPILSLHELHLTTRISKQSLLRILATLEQSGLVSRRLGDGRYRVSASLTRMPQGVRVTIELLRRQRLSWIGSVTKYPGRLTCWCLQAIIWK